jgi:predicted nucleic acid-binding protein
MIIFLDTSAWIKSDIEEHGTVEIQNFMQNKSQNRENKFVTSAVTYAEMIATFKRGLRGGRLTENEYNRIILDFKNKWDDFYIPEVDNKHIEQSGQFAEKYTLKGCDAFQLSSAIVSHATIFVCSDNGLINAAKDNGLIVWNPIDGEFTKTEEKSG